MDALLAARLAAGDDHALAEVFDWLASAVYGAALRVLGNGAAAQDVVQDVFVELWIPIGTIRLRGRCAPSCWCRPGAGQRMWCAANCAASRGRSGTTG
jgi:DNA-directed RNA polymerase specialized sigma24 family protein